MVHIDFTSIVTSKSQPEPKLMHPSVSTAVNKKRWIHNKEDLDNLISEFYDKNLHEEIILTHNSIRTPGTDEILSSKLKIIGIPNLYIYLMLADYE